MVVDIIILLLVPSGPPQDVLVTAVSPQNISVSWIEVRPEDKNGIIKGYKLVYQALPNGNETTETINIVGEAAELTTTLHNLNEFTNYSIAVLAFTVKGDGPLSVAQVVQTQQDSKCFCRFLSHMKWQYVYC